MVLLIGFVALQARVAHPLLPLRVVTDRDRGGAYLAIATAGAGVFGAFLFLTFYMQTIKGFTAFETGLAFLPMTFAIVTTAALVNTKLLVRTGPRPLIPTGMVLAALGMALLTGIGVDTSYVSHRRSPPPRSACRARTPASRRRWSTRRSRSAARSARRC